MAATSAVDRCKQGGDIIDIDCAGCAAADFEQTAGQAAFPSLKFEGLFLYRAKRAQLVDEDRPRLADAVRHPQGAIAGCIEVVGEDGICTSPNVAANLRYSAAKRGPTRLCAQLDTVRHAVEVMLLDRSAGQSYDNLLATLERIDSLIRPNGLLTSLTR